MAVEEQNDGFDIADLLAEQGITNKQELFEKITVIDNQIPTQNTSRVDSGGFVALGYDGECNVIWSNRRECVARISNAADHMKLKSLFGSEWIQDRFPKFNAKGENIGINWEELTSDIVEECSDRGVYSESKVRGAGVWEENGEIIINADTLSKSTGEEMKRVGEYIYEKEPTFYNVLSSSVASDDECRQIFDALDTFNFNNRGDCMLLHGFISASFLCGALEWRPHVCLTGRRGTGKSTLDGILANLMGEYALHIEGDSTDAGIRQRLRHDARPVIIDEFGAEDDTRDSRMKAQKVVRLMRSACSDMGSGTLRGTADQSGTSFAVRFMCIVSGTTPPAFTAADLSRIVTIELRNVDKTSQLPSVFRDRDLLGNIGEKMFKRMIGLYSEFNENLKTFKKCIIEDSTARAADTLGVLLAASATMTHGKILTENEVKDALATVEFGEHYESQNHLDEVDVLQHLLSTMITFDDEVEDGDYTKTVKKTENILNLIRHTLKGNMQAGYVLEQHGIKANQGAKEGLCELLISAKRQHVMLNKLFSNTRWEGGGWTKQLKRLEGSDYKNRYIDGSQCKATIISVNVKYGNDPIKSDIKEW